MTPKEIAKLPYRKCVGIMLVNSDNQVFTGLRKDGPKDAWQMPQGGVDKGEDPRDAAFRELWEETGVVADLAEIIGETDGWLPYDLPHDLVPNIWKGRYRGQKQKWYLMRYKGEDDQINIETEHPEFATWRWTPVDQLVDSIVPFKRAVYEQVVGVFSPHL